MPGSKPLDLRGRRFGDLVAIEIAGRKNKKMVWRCNCDCGRSHLVKSVALVGGTTVSCGCRKARRFIQLNAEQTTHGQSYTTEYKIWQGMLQRCTNPKSGSYKRYGARGIYVDARWQVFESFLEDMGKRPSARHTLDRKNNDGPYTKDNCRWATPTQQQRNRTNTRHLTIDGVCKPLMEWAEEAGIKHQTVATRLRLGWSHHSAVFMPPFVSYEIVDRNALFQHLKADPLILDVLQKLVDAAVAESGPNTVIPGVKVVEKQEVSSP